MKLRSLQNVFGKIMQQRFVVALVPLFSVVLMVGGYHDGNGLEGVGDMAMKKNGSDGKFNHNMTMDGVKAEFQIIDLESMNMKDPNGTTHHVMVKFFNADTGVRIKTGSGKIKVIAPSEEASESSFRDYSGIYTANFIFFKPGNYRIVCHAKINSKNPLYQFWYHYHH